jgi:hypothetical protein
MYGIVGPDPADPPALQDSVEQRVLEIVLEDGQYMVVFAWRELVNHGGLSSVCYTGCHSTN